MDRQIKIELLDQLNNGLISLDEFKQLSEDGGIMPHLAMWQKKENELDYYQIEGELLTKDNIRAKYKEGSSIILIEPHSRYLELGKNLKELLK